MKNVPGFSGKAGDSIMKYVKHKGNRKKYYPFYYGDKVYVLCESAIYCVGMNNEDLVQIVSDEDQIEGADKNTCQVDFEFQELLVRVADENREWENTSSVVSDELKVLRCYIDNTEMDNSRMRLSKYISLLETTEERSHLKLNPEKAMPASFFTFEKYEENGIEKMKLSRYLGSKKKNLKVPAKYEYLPVDCLGEGAFSHSKYLETVTLPEGITKIEANCFAGINSMKMIILEETKMSFPQIVSMENDLGDHFLFGVVTGDYLSERLPEITMDQEVEKPIAFAGNGIIFAEGRTLIKIDLITKEKKQYEMPEILAQRLEKTLVEIGTKNRKFLEESRCLSFFWKELKRYQEEPEDSIRNFDYLLRGLDDSLSCKSKEAQICFFHGEQEIGIADLLVFAGEGQIME